MIIALAIVGILLSLLPALTFLANLPLFACLLELDDDSESEQKASVLIPARDEEDSIAASIAAALESEHLEVEVIVYDDHSTDRTAEIVQQLASSDPRVRYFAGGELPDGWNGKQHACYQLAQRATNERIVFLDADVRLRPSALARLVHRQEETGVDLLSAFPHQETGTWLEKWIIPMMHFILLGFLPFSRMRSSEHPAYAAGCGQLFMTTQTAYQRAGTHEAIRESRHDGLKLPRVYRESGQMTDVVDGTNLAVCRMYHSAAQVVGGVMKNAIEAIANPRLIVVFTVLLIGGSVLPLLVLGWSILASNQWGIVLAAIGVILGHMPRAIAAVKFHQSPLGVLCHGPATLLFVLLQWVALFNHLLGRQVAWRGRRST